MLMRSALFCDSARRRVVSVYRHFGTAYCSYLQGSWPLKIGPRLLKTGSIHCPETSVNNYDTATSNIAEEHRSIYLHVTCNVHIQTVVKIFQSFCKSFCRWESPVVLSTVHDCEWSFGCLTKGTWWPKNLVTLMVGALWTGRWQNGVLLSGQTLKFFSMISAVTELVWPFNAKLLKIYCSAYLFMGMTHLELLSDHVQGGLFILIRFLLFWILRWIDVFISKVSYFFPWIYLHNSTMYQGSKCFHGMVCVARLFIIILITLNTCSLDYSTSFDFVQP